MLALRVETLKGKGPYHGGNPVAKVENELGLSFTDLRGCHPIPEEDSELRRNCRDLGRESTIFPDMVFYKFDGFHFGFESVNQFRRWFYNDEILKGLKALGFVLSAYSSPDIRRGNTQCVFRKGKRVATFDLLERKENIQKSLDSLQSQVSD